MSRELPMADRPAPPRFQRALSMACASRETSGPPHLAKPPNTGARLSDRYGRRIRYLRLSVTDRCNLRCHYCVPVSQGRFLPRPELLSDDEIVELLTVMASRGLEKVRFTGGEPLIRPGFLELVRRVRAIGGIRKLCVSTNGLLLDSMAESLLEAGIDHVNVSLDTLSARRFREITRGGDLGRVLRGLDRMLALVDTTLKVNAVLMRGVNDDEIDDFLALTRDRPLSVRFIELMPLAHCGELHDVQYLAADSVLRTLRERGAEGPLGRGLLDGPARVWRLPGAAGTVGVISAVSDAHFCDSCNRVRLSADGQLKLCLFGHEHVDLRAALRGPAPAGPALHRALDRAMELKPLKMAGYSGFTMMGIGG
jgi:cyclic pyranopterin phosphate synthase